MSKAFDKVRHEVFNFKFKQNGIKKELTSLLLDLLKKCRFKYGVTQGPVLKSLLF